MFKKKSLTASSLGIRILMGGYLVYLAYKLIPSLQKALDKMEMIFWGAIITLFFGVGAVLIFFSAKAFVKGEYDKENNSEEDERELDTESGNVIEEEDIIEEKDVKEEDFAELEEVTEEDK